MELNINIEILVDLLYIDECRTVYKDDPQLNYICNDIDTRFLLSHPRGCPIYSHTQFGLMNKMKEIDEDITVHRYNMFM